MKSEKMKAIVSTSYGSPGVLQLRDVAKPLPEENEVLIKVIASTVTAADSMMRRAEPFFSRFFLGLTKPKKPITGTGFAGVVESVGKAVTYFKPGDPVFGETGVNFGANAEYVVVAEDGVLAIKPPNIGFEEAATITDGPLTSLNFLNEIVKTRAGQRVLIIGASGSLGTAAVQLAKHFGAEVTGVCGPTNVELVNSLGADYVIDYTEEDFTQNDQTYDIIFDTVGKSSFKHSKASLSQSGTYISSVLKLPLLFQMLWTSKFGSKRARFSATGLLPPTRLRAMLGVLVKLLEKEQLKVVIDRYYALEEATEAHRYVDKGHKKGNVVLTIDALRVA